MTISEKNIHRFNHVQKRLDAISEHQLPEDVGHCWEYHSCEIDYDGPHDREGYCYYVFECINTGAQVSLTYQEVRAVIDGIFYACYDTLNQYEQMNVEIWALTNLLKKNVHIPEGEHDWYEQLVIPEMFRHPSIYKQIGPKYHISYNYWTEDGILSGS